MSIVDLYSSSRMRPVSRRRFCSCGHGTRFATPGTGVDATNGFKAQNNSATNLFKIAADFYLQGFCHCSAVLGHSAFYEAAAQRTRGILDEHGGHMNSCINSCINS